MSPRILVVDDDTMTLKVLRRLLASEGFVAEASESGAAALAQLQAADFDILLTDLVMPEMDGLALTVAARTLRPALRCMIMSGLPRLGNEGVDVGWIAKPLDIDTLLGLLAK